MMWIYVANKLATMEIKKDRNKTYLYIMCYGFKHTRISNEEFGKYKHPKP